ncbi:MAG: PAS domain S-box-containing protein [Polaribacter sp.]|jgi:PAS domain S-box-containing protein
MEDQDILYALYEEATIGMLVVNAAGVILNVNPFLEKMFAYAEGELKGKGIEVLLPGSFRSKHLKYRQGYNKNPAPRSMGVNLDLYGLRKNGEQFPVQISLSYVKNNGEQLAIAYIHDASEAKQKANELEIKTKAITAGAMPIAFVDLANTITEVNDAFVSMWGYSHPDEVIGIDISELGLRKEDVDEIIDGIKETDSWSGETIAKRKDGSSLEVYASAYLLTDENDRPYGILSSFLNLNELKKAQNLNQDVFKIIEDSLNEIFIFEADTLRFVHVNKGARNNIGYTLEEMQQMTPVDIKPSQTEASFRALLAPLLKGEKEKIEFEIVHERKDKTTYPVEVHLQYSKMGDQPVFVAIIIDITETKKAQLKLENLNLQLEEKVKMRTRSLKENETKLEKALEKEMELSELKSRFVSMASHEFRTPLSSILSSAGLISRYTESEQQENRVKHIGRIKSSVTNLTSILNDFLSLEKLESGKISCQMDEVNIPDFVAELLSEVKLLNKENQQIIHQHSGEAISKVDQHLLKNILLNLLSNAIKYSPKGKNVDLISQKKAGVLSIKVRDYGIGIPLEDQQHMFTRFFRANNVINIQGTGLGLTIVKRYLDLMKGSIDFESVENEGTTFIVKIPQ